GTPASPVSITGSNTFKRITQSRNVAYTISVANGTTQTLTDSSESTIWRVSGSSGKKITIQSAGTSAITFSAPNIAGGRICTDYLTLARAHASAGSGTTWNAGANSNCTID